MINLTTKLGKTEQKILLDEKNTTHFNSNFRFLKAHNGFRPGNTHVLLGTSGGGKSTLVRSIIVDLLCNIPKRKVLLWLSEETRLQFLTEFNYSQFDEYENNDFYIISEMDNELSDEGLIRKIEDIVFSKKIDIVVYDNLTTSQMYMGKSVSDQSKASKLLKKMATAWNVPMFVVAHARADITENYNNIINMNDIRGGKDIVNQAEFFYIMQTFFSGNSRMTTLRMVKHRGYLPSDFIYQLNFSAKNRLFFSSDGIPFKKFKEAYKSRNKL